MHSILQRGEEIFNVDMTDPVYLSQYKNDLSDALEFMANTFTIMRDMNEGFYAIINDRLTDQVSKREINDAFSDTFNDIFLSDKQVSWGGGKTSLEIKPNRKLKLTLAGKTHPERLFF